MSGSYPAFRTSVRIVVILSIRPGWLPGSVDSHDAVRAAAATGMRKGAISKTAPFMLDDAEPSLRTEPVNQMTEHIHGSDARYLLHRLLPPVRRRVQASPSV
ncbi:hypothetical protein GCM10025863_01700 [Microbacterium suwonense]|uniref:Uncharacterized protein n=1 Tax=Microbacterium suwonense TaxID=683047 RepID=A0ABN6WYL1_9MICO|nr:hypothetical protein GCM10025863_01700 [Microbacterium suwonense]